MVLVQINGLGVLGWARSSLVPASASARSVLMCMYAIVGKYRRNWLVRIGPGIESLNIKYGKEEARLNRLRNHDDFEIIQKAGGVKIGTFVLAAARISA